MSERVARVVLTGDASSLIRAANSAATALGRLGTAGNSSSRSVASSSANSSRAVAGSATRISGSARDLGSSFQTMGGAASSGFGKLVAVAGGAVAAVGGLKLLTGAFKSTVQQGMDFQSTLNNLGAVTGSTAAQLATVGAKARSLGNDIDLPAASASDAAQAMLELAKGGLTVKQSMDAAKGTLTLAAAAQIDGASAATIQSAALNTFGLSADKAGHVADVLANTANAASGEITDFAAGLQQSGSVAAGFGISLDDTATVLGLFANNGIKGSDAGTSFKTMLTQLAAPTAQAKAAMETLGLTVYDANGQFVGAEALTQQLAKAQGHLTQAQFNGAAATVFGTDAIRGANILAKEGTAGYDAMAKSVSKAGGAQQVAAAQTKGLKGALGLVKNAIQDVQLNAFDTMAPSLEAGTRKLAAAIPQISAVVLPIFQNIVEGATGAFSKVSDVISAFGPDNVTALATGGLKIKDAVAGVFHEAFSDQTLALVGQFGTSFVGSFLSLVSDVTDAATKFVTPVIAGASTLVSKALPYVTSFVGQMSRAISTAVTAVEPLGKAIGDVFSSLSKSGVLDTFGAALTGVGSAAQGAANLLTPLTTATSGILKGFSELPGQAQGPLLALVAVFALSGPIGRIGLSIKSAMQTAYLNTLYGIDRIKAGMAAGMAGIGASMKGLLAAFGGPLGLAIVGVTTFLSFLPQLISGENGAANAADNHASAVNALAGAYQTSNGLVDENVRKTALAQLQSGKWGKESTDLTLYADNLKSAGGSTRDLVDGMLGIAGASAKVESAYQRQVTNLNAIIKANTTMQGTDDYGRPIEVQNDTARAAAKTLGILNEQHVAYSQLTDVQGASIQKAKDNAAATKDSATAVGAVGAATVATGAAFQTAGAQASTASAEWHSYGEDAATAASDAAGAYKAIGASAPDAAAQSTAVADALKAVSDAANVADQNAQFFLLTMQRIGGKDVTAQQALDANAASVRAIGAAYRDVTQNLIDQRKAAADLQKTKDNLNKTELVDKKDAKGNTVKDSKGNAVQETGRASDATTADDIAAAQLRLAAANAAVAGSQAGVNDAMAKGQQSAATLASSILSQEVATKGITVATKDAKAALAAQREEFIKQISTQGGSVAATAASIAAANKLADSYGLIPKTVDTTVTATYPTESTKEFKRLGDAATKARTTKFNAATKDAIGDIGLYGQTVSRFPKGIKTQFNADVTTAEARGKHLYRTYDATTGNWKAEFLTPNEATARVKAKGVVQEYDKAKGTWTANMVTAGVAKAAADIAYVQSVLDGIKDKTVSLKVNAVGIATPTMGADGTIRSGSGAILKADGGYISGPGGPRDDQIPARLSNGEFVVNAAATAKNLSLLHSINSQKFANGGLVGKQKTLFDMSASGNIDAAVNATNAILSTAQTTGAAVVAAANAAAAAAAAAMRLGSTSGAGGQDPSAFGWTVGKNIQPFSFQGIQFPNGVAGGTQSVWTSFLSQLAPMIPGGIRPGEDWGYENRDNVNSPGKKSFHAYGLALDVNSSENPNNGIKGPAGNGRYQIPASAGPLAAKYNMQWGADWGDAMHFELHQAPAGYAARAAGSPVSGPSSGSGVERWRTLALQAAAAKGEAASTVDVMLKQMARESGGNVNAINLTDSNARKGTPSKGLLQFIDPTFQSYADPGHNSNIYDPYSQMLAWYNYLNGRYGGAAAYSNRGGDVYGAYANGGVVRGPGTGRSDSISARVSNGEYIVNAASTAANLPLLHAINSFANGGLVGSLTALSGRTQATAGPELSQVVQALADIAQAVRDARQTANDKTTAAAQAKTAVVDANHTLAVSRNEKASKQTIAANVAAVAAAKAQSTAADNTAASYRRAASAAEAFQKSQQKAYRAQQTYAARMDDLSGRLTVASDKLSQLKSDRASMASGISNTVSGFDGGITGHNDTRTKFDTIFKGQQYDMKQAQAFSVNIAKLRKLGLSNDSLNSIATAGVDGGGATAAGLASATAAQIKQLNGVTGQVQRIGANVGNLVAGQFYDAGIRAGAGLVNGITSQIGAIQRVMNHAAAVAINTLTHKLDIHSPSRVMHGLGVNIPLGLANGVAAGTSAVAKAVGNMVAIPNMTAIRPMQTGGSTSSAGQQHIDVQVYLDGKRIDDRIDVKVNGSIVQLGHDFEKAAMQS